MTTDSSIVLHLFFASYCMISTTQFFGNIQFILDTKLNYSFLPKLIVFFHFIIDIIQCIISFISSFILEIMLHIYLHSIGANQPSIIQFNSDCFLFFSINHKMVNQLNHHIRLCLIVVGLLQTYRLHKICTYRQES